MKVAGSYIFDAPPRAVWDGLQNPEILAATMPGCDKLELVGENAYEGILNIRVGPVQDKFQGNIQLEDVDPPNGYTMVVDGKGAPGFVNATAKISMAAQDGSDGEKTKLDYDGDAKIGGRIAGVGQRLLDSSAKAIIKQSLEGLNENLKARSAAPSLDGAEPRAVIEGPSQGEFAAKVAKEVAKDLVPKPVRIAAAVLVLLLILLVLYFLLR